jgi:site-specific recombinase XerD
LRAIHSSRANRPRSDDPAWLKSFLNGLSREDLSPATLRGYRYDLHLFLDWRSTVEEQAFSLERLAEFDLIAYRQHMVAAGRRPVTINRRLDALRRLCRWAQGAGVLTADMARDVRPVRTERNRQPAGMTGTEIHGLLRAAGASTHGHAARNYALVQLMLQAGLRIGEVAALQVSDLTISDCSGSVRIRHGKGLKARDVPLNATARRALRQYLDARQAPGKPDMPATNQTVVKRGLCKRSIEAEPFVLPHGFSCSLWDGR